MINFYIPDFYEFFKLNTFLIQYLRDFPQKFYDNIKIGAIYGCFPNQIWNSGRYSGGISADISNIEETIKAINQLGIPIRFTYTNSCIREEHLSDRHCNFVTECGHNGMNEILVNSPLLEEYLRKKYPNYKYISSTTRCIRDINKLNELIDSNKYSLVLSDYRDNFDFDFLNKINNKKKLEILVDPVCKLDCKLRESHFLYISQVQLGEEPTVKDPKCECEKFAFYELLKKDNIIKVNDLYNKYYKMGFEHFKLEGRNNIFIDVIDSYMYYLVRPEYKDEMRNLLVKAYIY